MPIQRFKKTKKRPTAQETFITKKHDIDTMLTRLVKLSDNDFNMNLDTVHWGHVGSIFVIAEQLNAITDQVFKEGEHAD